MIYRLEKEFTFEAAHRLIEGYEGKCRHNHGHSWTVRISLEGGELDKTGMLVDFEEMKKLGQWIKEKMDHATLLHQEDDFLEYLTEQGHKVFAVDGNPTSENIARVIFSQAGEMFEKNGIRIVKAEVDETCTSRAIIRRSTEQA